MNKLLGGIIVGIMEMSAIFTLYAQQFQTYSLKFTRPEAAQKKTQIYSLERRIEEVVQTLDPVFADIINSDYTSDVFDRPVSFLRYQADNTDHTDASFEELSYRIFLRNDKIQRSIEAIPHELWHAYTNLRKDDFLGPRHTYPSDQTIAEECQVLIGTKMYEKMREQIRKNVMQISILNKELYCEGIGAQILTLNQIVLGQVKKYILRHQRSTITTVIVDDKEYRITIDAPERSLDYWIHSLESQLKRIKRRTQYFQKNLNHYKNRSIDALEEKKAIIDLYFNHCASTIDFFNDIITLRDKVYRTLDEKEDKAHEKLRQFYCHLLASVTPNQRQPIGRWLLNEDNSYTDTLRFRKERNLDKTSKNLLAALQKNYALTVENHRLQQEQTEQIMNDPDEIMPRVVEAIVTLEIEPNQNQYALTSRMLEFIGRFQKDGKPILEKNIQKYQRFQTMVRSGIPKNQARSALRGKLNNFTIKGRIPSQE